ncbi:MAG: hypothetical protein ACREMA_19330 [Longimicrobiales bacterium]
MVISTKQDLVDVTIRFTKGTCFNGVDYGPKHKDEPVTMPNWQARQFLQSGRAVLIGGEVQGSTEAAAQGEVSSDASPDNPLVNTTKRVKK